MRNLLLLLFALPLLACRPAGDRADSGEAIARDAGVGDAPTGRVGRPVAKGADRPVPDDIDEGIEPAPSNTGANASEPVDNSAASLPTSIPAQFHGRWGLVAADCEPGRADAKGLMRIDDKLLTFYESRGSLERVDSNVPSNRFTAHYGFSGEGMTWERTITFTRSGGKLRRTEAGGEEGPVDLTYTACPSQRS